MSEPIMTPAKPCKNMHFNHTHGRERPGMPVHCSYCGAIAPGHGKRMATEQRLAAKREAQ